MNKVCKQCASDQPVENFCRHARMKDGLHYYCKSCMSARTSKWRKENPEKSIAQTIRRVERGYFEEYRGRPEVKEKAKARSSDWAKNNRGRRIINEQKRRASCMAGGSYSLEEWESLCKLYENKCLSCGSYEKLTVDHVVPLSRGGSNTIDNLQPLCKTCNCKKSNKTIDYRIREGV